MYIPSDQLFSKSYFIQKDNDNILIFFLINIILHLILFTILFTKANDNPLAVKTLLHPIILIQTCRNFKMHFLQRFFYFEWRQQECNCIELLFSDQRISFWTKYIACHQIKLTLTGFLVHFYIVKENDIELCDEKLISNHTS